MFGLGCETHGFKHMPQGEVHFANIQEVLHDFLTNHARAVFSSIQKCTFGQAYVQFQNPRDRDRMVDNSPHIFEDVQISFVKHDQGRNWHRAYLNRECWLLLVGPPLDHLYLEDITHMFCDVGKILIWEKDPKNKEISIVKIRCTELIEIPKSIRLTDGDSPESES